jgi:hypothetical protein
MIRRYLANTQAAQWVCKARSSVANMAPKGKAADKGAKGAAGKGKGGDDGAKGKKAAQTILVRHILVRVYGHVLLLS